MNVSRQNAASVRFGVWSDEQRQAMENTRQGGIADIEAMLAKGEDLFYSSDSRRAVEERLCRQIDSLTELKQVEAVVTLLGDTEKTTIDYKYYNPGRHRYEDRTTQYQPSAIVLEAIVRAYRRLGKIMT